MAPLPQSATELSIPEIPRSEPPRVQRIVCGWNKETNTFLYRDEVISPPPLVSDGWDRDSKRPKTTTAVGKVQAKGMARMAKCREQAARKGKNRSQLQQPRYRSTPLSEASRQTQPKQASSLTVNSEAGNPNGDDLKDPAQDEPVYVVPNDLQGTINPVPTAVNKHHIQWKDLQNTIVPLSDDPTVNITGFDNIMVTTISQDNGKPHNEPAKVLDCRLHPNGTYFLLVSWWFERRSLLRSRVGCKRYLDRKWLSGATYQYILGCHFDVITSESIIEKIPEDERFCKSMVYGGMYHNHELFSDKPGETERRQYIGKTGSGDEQLVATQEQKSLYQMLFPSL